MRLLSKRQVVDLVPFSPQHIQRLEDAGRFPKRLKLGNGGRNAKAFWVEQEVLDWIKFHIDRRDEPTDTPNTEDLKLLSFETS